MNLTLTVTGFCCDLALHPVDAETAARVCLLGENLYKTNSIEWWRANVNNTCGMRLTAESRIEVSMDGAPVAFDADRISTSAAMLTQRAFIDSAKPELCLLGYDDESCSRTWTWHNVTAYDPAAFDFIVQRWDRILGMKDYLVLDDICYDERSADTIAWGESDGFTFIRPMIVPMDVVRSECGIIVRKAA